jgi:hypothetical protein
MFANSLGNWQNWPAAGDTSSNPYTQVRFLSDTKLPEHFSEVLTFYRDQDDEGGRLSEDCHYLLSMPRPTARRWSVSVKTIQGAVTQLVTQDDVISNKNIVEINLSGSVQPGNWLQLNDQISPKVVLRLYDGDTIIAQGSGKDGKLDLPLLKRVACS